MDGRVYFEQHISEMTYIPNALRFWMNIWYQTQLFGFSQSNVVFKLSIRFSQKSQNYDELFCWFFNMIFYLKFKLLDVIRFHIIFLFNLQYFKFLQFWSMVESDNGKMKTCSVELTKYLLIKKLKWCVIFIFEFNCLVK